MLGKTDQVWSVAAQKKRRAVCSQCICCCVIYMREDMMTGNTCSPRLRRVRARVAGSESRTAEYGIKWLVSLMRQAVCSKWQQSGVRDSSPHSLRATPRVLLRSLFHAAGRGAIHARAAFRAWYGVRPFVQCTTRRRRGGG